MIKIHLSKLLGAKRISMSELARQTGLSRNTIFLLYHEKSDRIDLTTLDRLCVALSCQPGELLEHITDNEQ
jgi:putative transcriptional regulator